MIHLLSHAEQLASYLRAEILRGRWRDEMPGVARLEAELGINHTTMGQALRLLEDEGLLESKGDRQRRRIIMPKSREPTSMRVGIFLYEPADRYAYDVVRMQQYLMAAGYPVRIPRQSLTELDMNVERIARVCKRTSTDVWVVLSASRPVLEWFAHQPVPSIAFFGEYTPDLPMAAVKPSRDKAIAALMRRLVKSGHRRIVLLTRSGTEPPWFLNELQAHGIPAGEYNFPKVPQGKWGIQRCLNSLFAVSPPTAMLIDESVVFFATQNHLARHGIHAPEQVSLICADPDPSFGLHSPSIAHIHWDYDAVVRRLVRWLEKARRGKVDQKMVMIPSDLVDGGTIGPAPKRIHKIG